MSVKFELDDDEIVALMQCASAGAAAAQILLGANARPMAPIFQKIQAQFSKRGRYRISAATNGGQRGARQRRADAVDTG